MLQITQPINNSYSKLDMFSSFNLQAIKYTLNQYAGIIIKYTRNHYDMYSSMCL